eukprot:CAMPEP_0175676434 /NCGR_PEP_ID=MMETSP0097-20121207/22742_1 /TAXON_ID=311494 /ORGANISM="Alexandrium monilatum, Strain CCMP3105" /LENGTH=123 /DNA_ID=CAMNT_0016983177 /DNA_START=1 /DNA_END=370 /DNA_ORIENTATION=+
MPPSTPPAARSNPQAPKLTARRPVQATLPGVRQTASCVVARQAPSGPWSTRAIVDLNNPVVVSVGLVEAPRGSGSTAALRYDALPLFELLGREPAGGVGVEALEDLQEGCSQPRLDLPGPAQT